MRLAAPLLALALAAAAASQARAEGCADLLSARLTLPAGAAVLQAGLRAALADASTELSDGRVGSYTRAALARLCAAVPQPSAAEAVAGTLATAADYGRIGALLPDWPALARSEALAARLLPGPDGRPSALALRLAGPPALSAAALASDAGATGCTGEAPTDPGPDALAGRAAVVAAVPAFADDRLLCAAFGGPAGRVPALESLGRIEASLPGAMADLAAADFALWLGEDRDRRPLRLLGSDGAVVALVAEYRAANRAGAPRDFSGLYAVLPPSCSAGASPLTTDYVAFPAPALAQVLAPVDVPALLAPLADQRFESADALLAAIDTALAGQVGACARDQIRLAVRAPADFGRSFALDPAQTQNLALDPDFVDSVPAVTPLLGLRAPSRDALLAGVRSAIARAAETRLAAEVDVAAETLAAAAEPEDLPLDTRPADVPEFAEVPDPQTFGVTDNTIAAVEATVTDPEFRAAVTGADYLPAASTEVLKGDVRRILAPLAAARVETIVARDLARIQAAVTQDWSLTRDLTAAIAAAPGIAAAESRDVTPEAAAAMQVLAGLEYPNPRLFDRALAAVSPAPPAPLLDDAARAARARVPDPETPRDFSALAAADCGCVTARWDYTETFAFYPWWFAPPLASPLASPAASAVPAAAAGAEAAPPAPSPPLRQVDFGAVSRIAFYGPQFLRNPAPDPGTRGEVQLLHGDAWEAGRRDFVNAAHRHRAKAEVAVTLTGWSTWSDAEIAAVADRIAALAAPYPRFDDWSLTELGRGLPTVFDPARPDGVTLIADCYQGTPRPGDPGCVPEGAPLPVERLVTLVQAVSARLAARGQTVALALDVPLVGGPADVGLFDEIKPLIVPEAGGPPVLRALMVFLERPTGDAKKLLRGRLEHGAYRGVDRLEILRMILPVIPPEGHRLVRDAVDASPASAARGSLYGQFVDDLVYFQDNFAGVAFWPAPDPAAAETVETTQRLAEQWYYDAFPRLLEPFRDRATAACAFICPNRAWFAFAAWGIALATAGLAAASFYSGWADRVAFRWGVAWMGVLALFGILLVMSLCDHAAIWPDIMVIALAVALAILLAYVSYQRAQDGPMP